MVSFCGLFTPAWLVLVFFEWLFTICQICMERQFRNNLGFYDAAFAKKPMTPRLGNCEIKRIFNFALVMSLVVCLPDINMLSLLIHR
uniref:Uncharacterized protein n=1 Tax=Ixodes ricinus TaxID=34613 RepID=A0A6B0UAB7_IXORI